MEGHSVDFDHLKFYFIIRQAFNSISSKLLYCDGIGEAYALALLGRRVRGPVLETHSLLDSRHLSRLLEAKSNWIIQFSQYFRHTPG